MMNSGVLKDLSSVLRSNPERIDSADLPEQLLDTEYVSEKPIPESHTCPTCGGEAALYDSGDSDDLFRLVCLESHEHETTVTKKELTQYEVELAPLLEDIADTAGLTSTGDVANLFPEFAVQRTEEDVLVCLIGSAKNYDNSVQSAVNYILENQVPAFIVTPRQSVEELHYLIEPYAVVGIIQALTLNRFSDEDFVQETTVSLTSEYEHKQTLFDEQKIGKDDVRWKLEDHPSLIKSKLSTLRTLRENSKHERNGIGRTVWTEFEKVCKAAFAYLDFELEVGQGGVDNEGSEVADAVIGYPPMEIPDRVELSRLHGVVDAKSASQVDFDGEAVSKQLDYFDEIKGDKLYQSFTKLHLFVVFDFDAEKVLDWYETAKLHYPDQTGMVVLTADALRSMVDLNQSPLALSAVNRGEFDTRHVFRYFFDPKLYTRPEFVDVAELLDLSEWSGTEPETQHRYQAEDELLIVTQEMVLEWIDGIHSKQHDTDSLFQVE
ncbi:hypothetical protein [Halorientalis sp. IM1011]|uniref:hypothetical protein n=1 Tax=Halorientalis sp. IM1011 TaxID=1932360 RepID=UPI0012FA1422|nr:hypothetical protein [Halorientalis sp. IM1011]